MMSFDEFLQKVDKTFSSYSYKEQLRYGQTVMNVLWEVWPEKHQEIKGSDFDCFYDYATVQLTLDKLEKEWIV
jgi:hypothetical protein